MLPRLAASILVQALLRRIAAGGGRGTVIAKGDQTAGAILVTLCERGETRQLVERALNREGDYGWVQTGPKLPEEAAMLNDYLERRRRADPDLWIVELDIGGGERFASEMVATG